MSGFRVRRPGLLSLLQDRGRFGQAALGLTSGGPVDPIAAALANRLVQNPAPATLLEISFGGLELEAREDLQVAVTGAGLPLLCDGAERPMWTVLAVRAGQTLALGFSDIGCRSYLAVRGGFAIAPSFGSTSTVPREGIGGLNGGPLQAGDELPRRPAAPCEPLWLPPRHRPRYHRRAIVRVIPGYQRAHFPRRERRRFFSGEYRVSRRCDRMGYCLEGPAIACDLCRLLSEGIAPGAIQIPADGQPIVLLNDRQTIGGYPKLGTALSLDAAALGQLRPGDGVNFLPVTRHRAYKALHLARAFERSRRFEPASA